MERFIYRGVNETLHTTNNGRLVPKIFEPFHYAFHFGEPVYFGGGAVFGESVANAVIRHQQDQSSFPTSGISTTPFFDRAKIYATYNGKFSSGFIYKIDTALLPRFSVSSHVVSEYAVQPSIPEDGEIILVAHDFGVLPEEIVIDIIEI